MTTPPSAPRLVIVIVEPCSSSSVTVPSRAAADRRATSAASDQRSRPSACSTTGTIRPLVGLRGDAEVDGAVALDDAVVVLEAGVHLRELADGDDHGAASGRAAA